ncbi:MAG: abortive infection protein [Herminiimonas sp.]|nr:abortive infection protein [Herminiimonas sp.]
MSGALAKDLGLGLAPSFAGDRSFYLALGAAPLTLAVLTWGMPEWSNGIRPSMPLLLSMVLWQPIIEELLFRGVIQGQLMQWPGARRGIAGLSLANLITTLLFMLAHLGQHSPLWAAAVLMPSLIFGHFRDRHGGIFPGLILHAFYNGCYLLAGALLNAPYMAAKG